MVYAKASSVITAEITCEPWMHKFLIGPKGATLEVFMFDCLLLFYLIVFRDFFWSVSQYQFFFFSFL